MIKKSSDPLKSLRILRLMCAASVLCLCPKHGKADTAGVVTASNTLLTTSEIQTAPFSLATGYGVAQTYSLGNAEKWTNLPGNPPTDAVRVGPVIGGGPSSYTTYELSDTVSSGQTVSPRTAALTLASTALSAYGYNTLYEIRNADDVLRAVDTTTYNYGDYRVAILGTPGAGSPFLIKFAGHHLAYNLPGHRATGLSLHRHGFDQRATDGGLRHLYARHGTRWRRSRHAANWSRHASCGWSDDHGGRHQRHRAYGRDTRREFCQQSLHRCSDDDAVRGQRRFLGADRGGGD